MVGIDTNIVVRYIIRDDPTQFAQAAALIHSEACFLLDTVLLETVWVLQSVYRIERSAIAERLTAFLGLPTLHTAHPSKLQKALMWYAEGLDFADALHLASSEHLASFKTFDQRFIRRATDKSACTVEEPNQPLAS